MKWDAARHGRNSTNWPEQWRQARELNATWPGEGEWVPWMAIWIKDGIQPRGVDSEAVDRYADTFHALPPIRVQRDTFALIDGRHRLEAAPRAISDYIRIVEEDVTDDELEERAFLANIGHGLAYTLAERVQGLNLLMRLHPELDAAKLARMTGVSYDTAKRYRRTVKREAPATKGVASASHIMETGGNRHSQEWGSTITDAPTSESPRRSDLAAPARSAVPEPEAPADAVGQAVAECPATADEDEWERWEPFSFMRDGVTLTARYDRHGGMNETRRDAIDDAADELRVWIARIAKSEVEE